MARYALVGRTTPADMTADRREDIVAWLRALNINPDLMIYGRVAVVQSRDDRSYHLCLTELMLNDEGRKFIDMASNQTATKPLMVPIEEGSWPPWLPALGHVSADH